jgi:hypothetical protein
MIGKNRAWVEKEAAYCGGYTKKDTLSKRG